MMFPEDGVSSKEHVLVTTPHYIRKMGDIVKNTPKR